MAFDVSSPWGTYRPTRTQAGLLRVCRSLPPVQPAAALALLLRRPLKYGGESPLDTELWGLRLRLARRDSVSESRMLFTPQLFDRRERRALIGRLRPGDTFVDVGANVGGYAFWVHQRFRDAVRVLVVEADPELVERLRFNARMNEAERLLIAATAVGDAAGSGTLLIGGRNRGENRVLQDGEAADAGPGRRVTVPVRPLLDVLRSHGIDRIAALKIDIEGMEYRVLSHFFEHAVPALHPRTLLIEVKPTEQHRALLSLLHGLGYRPSLRTRRNTLLDRRA